ncbi:hypothetical protein OpiT1DRAFT_04459 [Opitutaceae bacterium TAV1]|nr:hypothetical protein OpiT1DRAFT_04459 [Opitutaceae bacterium TAV1]
MKTALLLSFTLIVSCLVFAASSTSESSANIRKIESNLDYIKRNDRVFTQKSAVRVTANPEHELLLSLAREVLALRKETNELRQETVALRTKLDPLKKEREKSE